MQIQRVSFYFVIVAVSINTCFARDRLHFCRKFKTDENKAQNKYDAYQSYVDYLIEKQIVTQPTDPGATLFVQFPINDVTNQVYENSTYVINLSETVAESVFENDLPRDKDLNLILAQATNCFESVFAEFCVNNKEYNCKKLRYRPIDAVCNDPKHPKDGAARTAFASLLYQTYDDSIQTIRKPKHNKKHLPSSRVISNTFFNNCLRRDVFIKNTPSMGAIMFGQLVSHDVSFRNTVQKQEGGPNPKCCNADFSGPQPKHLLHPYCEPIKIPTNDSFFKRFNYRCMNFLRSQNAYDNDCLLSSRKQLNLVTSMLDMSFIYGNSLNQSLGLRTMSCGKLKTSGQGFFPQDSNGNYFTGDVRFSQTPIIAVYHILFIREHNRICDLIKKYNPSLSDEEIFQESRRYVIAEYQHIFLYEWRPIFLNRVERPIAFKPIPYHRPVATTTNEFAHGSFRQFHHLVPQLVELYDEDGKKFAQTPLSDTFLDLSLVLSNYDDLVRALFNQKIDFNGCLQEIRNLLFKNAAGVGIDLLSTDNSRGRDHGFQPYYRYAQMCLFKVIKGFDDLGPEISDAKITKLKELYKSVQDIDLYACLRAEKTKSSYTFGPTTDCINAEQIFRYATADLFFYENKLNPYPFTKDQLQQIRRASFARILCDNSNIEMVPKNAFFPPSHDNPKVFCKEIPTVKVVDFLHF